VRDNLEVGLKLIVVFQGNVDVQVNLCGNIVVFGVLLLYNLLLLELLFVLVAFATLDDVKLGLLEDFKYQIQEALSRLCSFVLSVHI
jgi:hypothetical protein